MVFYCSTTWPQTKNLQTSAPIEVAVDQHQNFQGKITVFISNLVDLKRVQVDITAAVTEACLCREVTHPISPLSYFLHKFVIQYRLLTNINNQRSDILKNCEVTSLLHDMIGWCLRSLCESFEKLTSYRKKLMSLSCWVIFAFVHVSMNHTNIGKRSPWLVMIGFVPEKKPNRLAPYKG